MPEVSEVSFEWADGPNANAEFHRLTVYNEQGDKIDYRSEQIKYRKNGQWSYADLRVFVPVGSIVLQSEQNTHRRRENKLWIATENGRVSLATVYGKWSSLRDWPETPDAMTEDQWRVLLSKIIVPDVVEQWQRNATIKSI